MLAVILGGSIVALLIIGALILVAIRILKGGSAHGDGVNSDEARVIQEIYQGLSRMEERIEALETILLDHDRKERSK
jgi:phage shock protein B